MRHHVAGQSYTTMSLAIAELSIIYVYMHNDVHVHCKCSLLVFALLPVDQSSIDQIEHTCWSSQLVTEDPVMAVLGITCKTLVDALCPL